MDSLEHRTSVADDRTAALHRPAEAGTVPGLGQRADTRSVVAVVRPCVVASWQVDRTVRECLEVEALGRSLQLLGERAPRPACARSPLPSSSLSILFESL